MYNITQEPGYSIKSDSLRRAGSYATRYAKAIRSHADNQNLANTKVKGADKMGGKRGSAKSARGGRTAKAATNAPRK